MALGLEGADRQPLVVAERHCVQISLKPEQGHHFLVVDGGQPDETQISLDAGALQPVVVVAQLGAGVADSAGDCRGHSVGYKVSNQHRLAKL